MATAARAVRSRTWGRVELATRDRVGEQDAVRPGARRGIGIHVYAPEGARLFHPVANGVDSVPRAEGQVVRGQRARTKWRIHARRSTWGLNQGGHTHRTFDGGQI